ncbi:MAG: hypothetical protein PHG82_03490 [Candidatus Gracilibacteria bacterium]|nr:hypothetical protein [Candidatus Gracilibacteria bacterium]
MNLKTKIKNKAELWAYKYSHFFDTKLDNSTITVGIIGLFIFSVGISFGQGNGLNSNPNLKANLFETMKQKEEKITLSSQIIANKEGTLVIGGKTYRVNLEEVGKETNYCRY